jgi:RND family efflux transporter MFP subunit
MVIDKKIEQLQIDRSTPKTSKTPMIISSLALMLVITATIGFNLPAFLFSAKNETLTDEQAPTVKDQSDLIALEASDKNKSTTATAKLPSKQILNKKALNKQALNSILDASGHIIARRVATVSSRVTGKLNLLNIEEGQQVKKSQILAEIDDEQAKITYQLALAELTAKQENLNEWLLIAQQQTLHLKRNKLLATKNLLSEQLLEDSQFKHAQSLTQLNNKRALVTLFEQRVALAKYQLDQHKIRAPFDGVVISKNAQVGELISSGSSGGGFIRTGVGTLVDMSSLEIEVEVGESYINRVKIGQKAVAKLDAYPQWEIASEVIAIIPTANRQKASIKVRVKLQALDDRILPDMGVKVSFLAKS